MENFTATMIGVFWILAAAGFGLIGGIIGRWNGGGEPVGWGKYTPNPVDPILLSIPYAVIAFALLPWKIAAVLWILTVIAILKGHGRNMDLGTFDNSSRPEGVKAEWYEFLIKGLYGKIPEYWYDALGLAISGLTYTLPVGLAVALGVDGLFMPGMLVALSGALKSLGYMVGRPFETKTKIDDYIEPRVERIVRLSDPTSWGEFFAWDFLWTVAVPVFWILVL